MEQKQLPTEKVERWIKYLQEHNLIDLATILINLASAWGYIGGQILWMLVPFFGESKLKQLAELLEDPEALHELHDHLVR